MPGIRALVIHPTDDVAVVFADAAPGEAVEASCGAATQTLVARQAIPAGHKIALRDLLPGSPVHKYGEKIGLALQPISPGDHVHLHNLASDRVKA